MYSRISILFVCLSFFATAIACKTPSTDTSGFDKTLLGCWMHSHEENDPGGQVYRKCDYTATWPPSHYRDKFTLREDMTVEYLVLHPADAHYMSEGKWTYDAGAKAFNIIDSTGQTKSTYKIIDLQSDKMIVQQGM